MSYTPSPADLDEPELPAEWAEVADGMDPYRLPPGLLDPRPLLLDDAAAALGLGISQMRHLFTISVSVRDVASPTLARLSAELARFVQTYTGAIIAALPAYRGRRTGHRHRGTRAWARRHGPGRPDRPLGTRARA